MDTLAEMLHHGSTADHIQILQNSAASSEHPAPQLVHAGSLFTITPLCTQGQT